MDWIDKNHLDTFAARTDAQDLLPALIYDLILATSETPAEARFLSGAAGRVRGFDGVLTSRGSPPFVPAGKPFWEFGCEPTFKSKAAEDIEKRTRQVPANERSDITFVFVTPRTYDTPRELFDEWVAELGRGRGWKEVRVIDGARLKHWLAAAPGVAAHWASGAFGAYPAGVASTDEWWRGYISGCSVPLTEDVLLAGRADQQAAIIRRLAGLQPDRIEIAADSPDEALAFAVAVLRKAEPEVRAVLRARSIVLRTADAAIELDRRGPLVNGLIFFPTAQAAPKAGLLAPHGPTIVASGRMQGRSSSYVQLPRPPRHVFAEALASSGAVDRPKAAQLAAGCGSSVTVLLRLRPSGSATPPPWASGAEARNLIPALLAGAWDAANEADRAALAALSGAALYEDYEARIQHLLAVDDPPLERAGTVWKIRAPMDAFVLLGALATGIHLNRLRTVCLDVLGELDANLELDEEALRVADRGLKRSHWLREGLAMTLLLVATMHNAASFGASLGSEGGPEAWVSGIVRDLPGLSADTRLLASLQSALPLLAEAAPAPFAAAVARLLDGGVDAVAPLFRERTAFITPDARHIYLLWALEALAWDPATLPRAAKLLARLAAVDPGGKLANRPIESLREIFLPWLPHTDADLQTRLSVIEGIVRTDEQVGWKLCLRLLPEFHSTSSGTTRPRIRESGSRDVATPHHEQLAVYRMAARHILRLAGTDIDRWLEVIERLPDLPRDEHDAAVELLDKTFASFDHPGRHRLWHRLRDVVARHAGFQDADWALRGAPLDRLLSLVRRWEPEDVVARATPLFMESQPELLLTQAETPLTGERLEQLRADAVEGILATDGGPGILRLAEAIRNQWDLARLTGAAVATPEDALQLCLLAIAQGSERTESFAAALSHAAYGRFSNVWRRLLGEAGATTPASGMALLLLGLPDDAETWDFVTSCGHEVERVYWARKSPWFPPDMATPLVERAVRQLLLAGRAVAALFALEHGPSISPELMFEALDAAIPEINASANGVGASFVYAVDRVFEALSNRADVERAELAKREFAYLPLLTSGGRSRRSLVLFQEMAANPAFFVSLLTAVFLPASGERSEPTEAARKQAQAAFRALEAFDLVPGQVGSDVDVATLRAWVREVLRLTAEVDRAKIGEQYVGKIMARAPHDPIDGAWPARAVREILEEIRSDEVERGILIERFNMRGVYSKNPCDGGTAERALAAQNRGWATICAGWPRTADMLMRIADDWQHHAEREDVSARLNLMND